MKQDGMEMEKKGQKTSPWKWIIWQKISPWRSFGTQRWLRKSLEVPKELCLYGSGKA